MKANVYVDGFNLYYGAVKDMPSRCFSIAAAGMIADGESYKVPSTIDDPPILPEIEEAVETIGYGSRQQTA